MIDIASDDDINFVIRQGAETVGKTHYAIACELREHRDAERSASPPGFLKDLPEGSQPGGPYAKMMGLVETFRADEERLLRKVDALFPDGVQFVVERRDQDNQREQQRWRAIARTHIQEGFNAIERAIVQRPRFKLPEDT